MGYWPPVSAVEAPFLRSHGKHVCFGPVSPCIMTTYDNSQVHSNGVKPSVKLRFVTDMSAELTTDAVLNGPPIPEELDVLPTDGPQCHAAEPEDALLALSLLRPDLLAAEACDVPYYKRAQRPDLLEAGACDT